MAVEAAAVDLERQSRLDLDLQVVGQTRQERQRELQLAQQVLAIDGAIVEAHPAVGHPQIEQREARRCRVGLGRLVRRAGKTLQQVVDVEPPVGVPCQAQLRRVDLERRDHRRQTQQRARVQVDKQPIDLQLRRRVGIAGRAGQREVAQRQLQRHRHEAHVADAQLTPQQRRAARLQLPFQQRRQRQPGDQPSQQQRQHRPHHQAQDARARHIESFAAMPAPIAHNRSGSEAACRARRHPFKRNAVPCSTTGCNCWALRATSRC